MWCRGKKVGHGSRTSKTGIGLITARFLAEGIYPYLKHLLNNDCRILLSFPHFKTSDVILSNPGALLLFNLCKLVIISVMRYLDWGSLWLDVSWYLKTAHSPSYTGHFRDLLQHAVAYTLACRDSACSDYFPCCRPHSCDWYRYQSRTHGYLWLLAFRDQEHRQ